jgi:Zn-dependent peptidase ImmA (M78 family)
MVDHNGSLLRRGFKTWCENASYGYRRDLKLARHARLDPRDLALQIGVAILTPHEIPGLDAETLNHLINVDPDSWSAVTLTIGQVSIVITNSSHPDTRQNNSLAHELSHLILKHPPAQAFVTPDGMMVMNEYNRVHEEEANCLSATLLIPRDGLIHFLSLGWSDEQIAAHFGVSMDLLRMRKNLTGVERQLSRFRALKKRKF